MDAKLTLKLDKDVIEKAKEYAALHNKSLSRIVESYLQILSSGKSKNEDIEISPFVRSLSSGIHIPHDLDLKEEYIKHLEEKYK